MLALALVLLSAVALPSAAAGAPSATTGASRAPVKSAAPAAAFNGIDVRARVIAVDTTKESATVRVDPFPEGDYGERSKRGVLARDVVLYATALSGSLAHDYRAGAFMDPFETTVPLSGDTSSYPFHHLKAEFEMLAATGAGIESGQPVTMRVHISSGLAGYRMHPSSLNRQQSDTLVVSLRIDPSGAAVFFAAFIMVIMWLLALAAITVTVTLILRRRRFEGAFTGLLAALLFAFPTVRNTLPGIPPVGVLFDYGAFFWAEGLVALSLVALVAGWSRRHLVGTGERRD